MQQKSLRQLWQSPFFRRRKTFFGRRGQQENVLSEEPALPISSPVFEARHVEQVVQEPPTPVVPQRPVLSEEDLIGRIANNPKDFSSYEALGDYYLESGNTKDAKECYRQVLKLRPQERSVKIKIRRLEKMLSQR
ncbi:MAG: tetratricopeptide repeat protein [Candidatus Moraniibacteriota bacterium]